MQRRGDLRDRAAALRWSGDSAAHGGFSCRHHRPNTCCCGFTGEPFDPSTPLLSSRPGSAARATRQASARRIELRLRPEAPLTEVEALSAIRGNDRALTAKSGSYALAGSRPR
jgi:hypothetical protein